MYTAFSLMCFTVTRPPTSQDFCVISSNLAFIVFKADCFAAVEWVDTGSRLLYSSTLKYNPKSYEGTTIMDRPPWLPITLDVLAAFSTVWWQAGLQEYILLRL